jgi:hypothetical protein
LSEGFLHIEGDVTEGVVQPRGGRLLQVHAKVLETTTVEFAVELYI